MRKVFGLSLVVMMFWIMGALAIPAAAAGEIQVLSSEAQPHFAQNVVFQLDAQSSAQITEVTLFYQEALQLATNRAYPTFTPGDKVSAVYTWDLLPGEVPVGTQVSFYWVIKDASGRELKTEPQTFQYNDTRFDWKNVTQGNVTLYYYGGNQSRAQSLLKSAVDALSHISDQIGVRPKYPVRIYVYASKSEMLDALVSRSQSYDQATTTLGVLVSKDTVLLLGSAPGQSRTLAHELTHLVVGQATDNPYQAPIPRWLDEGLAMYNEGQLPDYNQEALAEAIATNTLISVQSLSAYVGDPNQVNLFYGEAYSVVSFLLKQYGKDKMVQLLGVFHKGSTQEDALKQVYGFGLQELDAKWRAYIGAPAREPAPTGPRGAEEAHFLVIYSLAA
jgi:hypothetical protein